MTIVKSQIKQSALLFLLALPTTTIAVESAVNESNTNSNNDIKVTVRTQTGSVNQQQVNDWQQPLQNMEQRHRQMQEAQLEAYKHFLENRKSNSSATFPLDAQNRRNEYIKQMEQRRTLIKNMIDEHRKAAQERRKKMLQKMHQTATPFVMAESA